MSGYEIAFKLTMFPYYKAFSPPSIKEQILGDLLGDTSKFAKFLLASLRLKTLRYCPKCGKEDVKKYGETYWKRSHQMKGVAVCPDHGEELIEVKLTHKSEGANLIDATEAIGSGHPPLLNLKNEEKEQLIAIARRCQRILNEDLEPDWKNASPLLYRKVAAEKGLCGERAGCERRIVEKFRETYSENVIRTFGLRDGKNTDDWVQEIFLSTPKREFQPIIHAVIQEFLSAIPRDSVSNIQFSLGPWKCPNPLGQHNTSFPIKKVIIERDTNQRAFARTTCCCGYGFTFYTTDSIDPSMPVVHKVTEYGPSWEDKIKALNYRNLSTSKIAQKLNVSLEEASNFLEKRSEPERSVTSLRRRLIEVLNATEHHTLRDVYLRSPALYKKVQKTDPNFLWCQVPHARTGRKNNKELRKKEDATRSVRLRAAAVSILNEVPPTLASKKAIVLRSGISGWSIGSGFPKCNNVLKEISESRKAFQMRRLKYLAEQAKAHGIKPTRAKLFEEGKIHNKMYTDQLANYVDSLCE